MLLLHKLPMKKPSDEGFFMGVVVMPSHVAHSHYFR